MNRVLAASALASAALVLAGCGATGDEAESVAAPTATDSQTPQETPEPTAASQPTQTDEPTQTDAPVTVPAALDFDAPTVDGGTFQGATLVGQDSVLYFWAPWCTVCRAEAPALPAVASDFEGQATFYGVAGLSPDIAAMQSFVSDTGTESLTHIADTGGEIYTGFGVSSQTTFAFVDDDGSIEIVRGPLEESELRERTQALVDG